MGKRRLPRRGVQYRVRWEGWREDHDSWEPKANISDDLIDEYEAMIAAAVAAAKRTGRRTPRVKAAYVTTVAERPPDTPHISRLLRQCEGGYVD